MKKTGIRAQLEQATDLILASIDLKLFMLAELGPTNFFFRDESNKKFKVVIGDPISCSCFPREKKAAPTHCIHT